MYEKVTLRVTMIVLLVTLTLCLNGATPVLRADAPVLRADDVKPIRPSCQSHDFVLCGKTWVNLSQVALYRPGVNGGCEIVGPAGTVLLATESAECGCIYAALQRRGEIGQ